MKGRINISRWSSNVEPYHGIRIEVIDESSRVHFLQVEMTLEQFANAITGVGECECEFQLRGANTVGKKLEHKTEIVLFDQDILRHRDEDLCGPTLAPFEINGWVADRHNIFNHHRQGAHDHANNTVNVRVSFTRYV